MATPAVMHPQNAELDDVLRELAGAGLYRNNAFRVTGLPVTASPAQIRRRREEAALAAQLGVPPAASAGELPLTPAPDWDTVKAAFESLRNPVLRLVHELLWLWGAESDHDYAVRRHCAVLEGQSLVAPGRPDMPNDPLGQQWLVAVQAWANVFAAEEIWDWARRRVKEIDDPRLTTGTVRRLRDRLPRHIIDVNLVLAVETAEEIGVEAADRYLWVLDESAFDEDVVDAALRDVVRPAEARVRNACEAADNVALTTPRDAIPAGHALLANLNTDLRMIAGLLGEDDPVTSAMSDRVAKAVNLCAVSYSNKTDDNGPAMSLLPEARRLAREQTTIDLVDKNMASVTRQLVADKVEDLVKAGRVNKAADRLRAWRRYTNDEQMRARITEVLYDPRALRAPLGDLPPVRGRLFGWGMNLVGAGSFTEDGKYVSHHFVTAFHIPVFPVAAYLQDSQYIYGKVPMSLAARRWRSIILPLLIAIAAIQPYRDLARLWIFLAVVIVAAGAMVVRRQLHDQWASEKIWT